MIVQAMGASEEKRDYSDTTDALSGLSMEVLTDDTLDETLRNELHKFDPVFLAGETNELEKMLDLIDEFRSTEVSMTSIEQCRPEEYADLIRNQQVPQGQLFQRVSTGNYFCAVRTIDLRNVPGQQPGDDNVRAIWLIGPWDEEGKFTGDKTLHIKFPILNSQNGNHQKFNHEEFYQQFVPLRLEELEEGSKVAVQINGQTNEIEVISPRLFVAPQKAVHLLSQSGPVQGDLSMQCILLHDDVCETKCARLLTHRIRAHRLTDIQYDDTKLRDTFPGVEAAALLRSRRKPASSEDSAPSKPDSASSKPPAQCGGCF